MMRRISLYLLVGVLVATCARVVGVPLLAQGAKAAAAKKKEIPSLRAETRGRRTQGSPQSESFKPNTFTGQSERSDSDVRRQPREHRLQRGASFDGDLRGLPQTFDVVKRERPEREGPDMRPVMAPGTSTAPDTSLQVDAPPSLSAPAPGPIANFDGLDFAGWGAGHPPDTNGDVGPTYYIQTINTSIGIYDKTGVRVAAFTFNTLMSQGNFGNLCDTDNFGDPVVLYDSFDDRWVITDFAFKLSGGAVVNPPGSFQCFAVSKSGDPVAGGWNFYSINTAGGLGDYPKFGIWPDGLYMSANMFGFPAGGAFQNVRAYALNKAQMYAGAPSVQVVSFDAPAAEFTLLPSNARIQTGTPPPGTPNYYVSTGRFLNALTVYKFHVDWNSIANSTFTGPDIPLAATSWPNANVPNAPSLGGNNLDVLQLRAMMQNQYTNIAGVESLWDSHTVRRANTTGFAAPRWYQVTVTGGTVAANLPQATTWDPDGANVIHRFMPSLAVDRAGDLAVGYSTSSSTTKPALKYAGRLAGDPLNTFSQTEQLLFQGTGTQVGNCGGAACTRWGDYSAMTLDPDGCTFWYTNEYYEVDGLNHHTRVGAFSFPECSPAGTGALVGTATTTASVPIGGAIVALGSRTTTTDSGGHYAFPGLPAGIYPSITASFAGYVSQTFVSIAVNEGATTTQDFVLDPAPTSGCITDTTQADFQQGVAANCDLTSSPGDVTLLAAPVIDQQQLNNSGSGVGITVAQWLGQTFVPAVTGQLAKIDLSLFCAGCSGANPPITIEVRTASGSLPTSTVLASTTIPGFSSGASAFYTATFASPATLTAGTMYAYTMRLATNRTGTYAGIFSTTAAAYPSGDRVLSTDGGVTWFIPTSAGTARDLSFKIYMQIGFAPSGTFVSSVKYANPIAGSTPSWSAISWNASVPSGTTLQFQAAASNSPSGPFTFVGPDGTPGTFFGNGGSLAQFGGNRYLQYKAFLTTSSSSATPTINDVTVCFANVPGATTLTVSPAFGTYGGTTDLAATLAFGGGLGLTGKSVTFTLNGTSVGSALTDGAGVAAVPGVSLTGIAAGTYPGAVAASFAGDTGYAASSGVNDLIVNKADQTITFGALGDKTYGDPDFLVSATASSGLAVTFSALGNCTIAGSTVHITGAGSCTITASQAGDGNDNAAPDVPRSFAIAKADQTITFGALGDKTYGDPDFLVSATASSGLAVTFSALGNCTVTGSTVHISGAGSCTITASQPGDANYNAAPDVPQSFSIAKASQTITFAALANKTYGDADFLVSASASSLLPVSFAASGNCTISGDSVHITGAGSCTVTASQAGDSNYLPAADEARTFSIDRKAASVTPNPASKTYGDADPPFSGTLSGFLPADGVTATYSRTLGETVPGSPYTISATLAPAAVLPNYTITYNTATFTIAPRAASVTPNAASKTYGSPDPPLSGTLSGFLPADGVTASYHRTPGETVAGSPYTISATLAPAAVLPNYAIVYNTAPFTIGRASLTATADDKTKVLNARIPPLTGTLIGVTNGDRIGVTFSTTAHRHSPVGTYPIVPALLDPNHRLGNYNVRIVNGTLTIIFAPVGRCDDGPGHQILPPIDPSGGSVFRSKRDVPVKFRVCDADGRSVHTPGIVTSFLLTQIIRGGVVSNVSIAPESANHHDAFRFDFDDRLWIFDLKTKELPDPATFVYRIGLADGSAITFRFTLRDEGRGRDER